MKFDTWNEIREYVSDRMPLDIEQYNMSYDELLDYATDGFKDYLDDHDVEFEYGMEIPPEWIDALDYADFSLWWSFFE